MDAKSELLTANNTTVYALTYLDLKTDGPTVVIAPPEVLGFADDMWMRFIGDIGKAGPDKGEGGKFLFLPPGFEGDVPDGYYVMSSKTYGVWMIMRGSVENGTTDLANERFEQLQVYPLADAKNPEPTELIDATGMEMYTVHSENYELLEQLGVLVEEEHLDALDGECHDLCVSGLSHAGFRYCHALKRSSNIMANWFLAANHSLTFRPSFSNFRMAR
jgi:hypothetical protein